MQPTTNIAIRAARSAGSVLMRYFQRIDSLTIDSKGKNDFVTEVDRASEQAIIAVLRKAYPSHSILAEESGSHEGNDFQWVIDPLDGTTNYLHGFPQFSISIALKHKGVLETAVVYDPLRDEIFTANRGAGAMLNDRRLRIADRKGLGGALLGTGFPYRDFRHMEAYMGMLQTFARECAGIRRPGSAALDFAYVAAGRLDGFWELGLAEWDFAAGALLVKEAGGTVSDIGGGGRFLETGNVVAGGLKLHGAMLKAIRPHLTDTLQA
ncbi:MAG: inositol monophosphatase [Candidatus Sedimenticola endophacoides]|uniref:Inositol-1-monophosphatase n=1 Tax=Candidatus Sedimenticola endophacoides TaxID=2548426 RepID=A0A6N4DIG2_9GAMM|nr:MAG: inositol monophosphatase [Candidatus Sedimenticola endophacoides]OQX32505.1 MAG: inositol monophosphatase [Candidatus Sedimenticola endophacoides]OQX40870.1 MAG: inositol monophosphatase [Candidatus Sedimenticola endophacoides]PUD98052.1 MAG: inositol monophosphatase [Candidatus Sedimenticola endophacoides]PUD98180.1 MAG: inositol monophosphatase [Candidatus Sedimenticola endophacoides]